MFVIASRIIIRVTPVCDMLKWAQATQRGLLSGGDVAGYGSLLGLREIKIVENLIWAVWEHQKSKPMIFASCGKEQLLSLPILLQTN